MQLLWSRAAQAYGASHCRACLAAATLPITPLHIANTPSFDPRRRLGAHCAGPAAALTHTHSRDGYAALSIDMLDLVFSDARPSLPCLKPEPNIPAAKLKPFMRAEDDREGLWDVESSRDGIAEALWSICSPQFQLKHHHNRRSARHQYLLQLYHPRQIYPPIEAIEATKRIDTAELEAAVAAEEAERSGEYRHPVNFQQVAASTDSILALSDDLMMATFTNAYRGDLDGFYHATGNLDGAWHGIKMLRSDGHPKYKNDVDPDGEAAIRDLRHSNQVMRVIFDKWQVAQEAEAGILKNGCLPNGERPKSPLSTLMVGRICFNLHAQSTRPDIHTFNTLIAGLIKVGEGWLACIVVSHLLRNTLLRPTPQTIICILRAYQARGDIAGFYHVIRRLIGNHSSGIKLRRAVADEAELFGRTYRHWLRTADITMYTDYLIQRASLTSEVVEALIRGLVAFEQGQHAAQILALALRIGFPVTTQTFLDLLTLVVGALDHGAASVLVRGLCANVDDLTSMLLEDECPREIPPRLRRVLDLYASRLLHKRWGSGDAENGAADRGRRLAALLTDTFPSSKSLDEADKLLPGSGPLLKALWIKEINDQAEKTANLIHVLGRQITSIEPENTSTATSSLQTIRRHAKREAKSTANTAALRARWWDMAAFHIVRERFEDLQLRTKRCEQEFAKAISAAGFVPASLGVYTPDLPEAAHERWQLYLGLAGEEALVALAMEVDAATEESARLVGSFKKSVMEKYVPFRRRWHLYRQYGSLKDVPLGLALKAHSTGTMRAKRAPRAPKKPQEPPAPQESDRGWTYKDGIFSQLRAVTKRAVGSVFPLVDTRRP
ncbi:hypothetical protein GGTG_11066 [Gaeumannomyces tritici R3-111a-1]|uniref:Pentatricopeptide repeat domain-containing protein n=1 Tax=Gaeumannomyces tritici (strain R3-111a-1) TaxID=644352 RepID=J3PC43_GAET3|nr:hypothetical protein GGTG_11066 [Gaeumannomyces tritici R3-111a-1]EJT71813.1 hypothetical protein GGTG_11066 [Gaeumannomyces tritici R3-111a-1]